MPEPSSVAVAKKPGCLFYAGIAAGVLFIGSILLAVVLINGARNLLRDYTGTSAIILPTASMPVAESDALETKINAFKEGVTGSNGASLVLGEEEINTWVARDPNLRELAGKVYIGLEGDKIKGQVSIPLDKSGVPFVRGRYFNGEVAVKVSLDNGILIVTIDSLVLNGKPLPEALMSALRSENLARDVYRRPKTAEVLRKFESIQVKEGKLSIKLQSQNG